MYNILIINALIITKMENENEKLLAELKEAMQNERISERTGTVSEWNHLREKMKARFPEKIISMLDASGFIVEWMKMK